MWASLAYLFLFMMIKMQATFQVYKYNTFSLQGLFSYFLNNIPSTLNNFHFLE